MSERLIQGRRVVDVPCTVTIVHTAEALRADVDLEGVDIEPGDEVIVHGAPTRVPFGETTTVRCRATVILAGRWERLKARIAGLFEITDLYEVGFSKGKAT